MNKIIKINRPPLRRPIYVMLIGVILALNGCIGDRGPETYYQVENSSQFEENLQIAVKEQKLFPLDSLTGFSHYSMKVHSTDSGEILSFINSLNNTIYFYDIDDPKFLEKRQFESEGPNGVGLLQLASHEVISNDSILIFNIWEGTIFLVNEVSEVVWKSKLVDYEKEYVTPNPEPTSLHPMLFADNNVMITTSLNRYVENYSERNTIVKVNIKTNTIGYIFPFSESYNLGHWGDIFKYKPSFVLMEHGEKILVSLPIDSFVYECDLDGNILNKHYVGSKFFNSLSPMNRETSFGVGKKSDKFYREQERYSFSQSDYVGLFYDNVYYYRLAHLRSKAKIEKDDYVPDISVIIFDSSFKKLGEKRFDGKIYDPSTFLTTSEGFLLARKDVYKNNEDYLPFDLFTISIKE